MITLQEFGQLDELVEAVIEYNGDGEIEELYEVYTDDVEYFKNMAKEAIEYKKLWDGLSQQISGHIKNQTKKEVLEALRHFKEVKTSESLLHFHPDSYNGKGIEIWWDDNNHELISK